MGEDFRAEPRFSMNKLAEYMVATSAIRRRNLIRDQIRVSAFKVARYTEGRRAMVSFLTNPSQSVRQLLGAASRLRDMVPTFPEKDDRRKWYMESARAVESLALIAEKLRNKKLLAVAGRKDADMVMSGLRIVIAPDVCFLERGTERRIGALKLHCSKGREDPDVAHKDRAARLWCENASQLTGQEWRYLKVPQAGFDKLQPAVYGDLVVFDA